MRAVTVKGGSFQINIIMGRLSKLKESMAVELGIEKKASHFFNQVPPCIRGVEAVVER